MFNWTHLLVFFSTDLTNIISRAVSKAQCESNRKIVADFISLISKSVRILVVAIGLQINSVFSEHTNQKLALLIWLKRGRHDEVMSGRQFETAAHLLINYKKEL